MNKYFLIFIITAFLFCSQMTFCTPNPEFRDYFADKTMRIDYYHTADKDTHIIAIDKIYMQGYWAGNPGHLIDPFDNGQFYAKIYQPDSGKLIFSRGFNSYCGEYITTNDAAKGIKRTYHESVLIPYPLKKIKFVLEMRDRKNHLNPIFETEIDPKSEAINKEPLSEWTTVIEAVKNGPPHNKVDLAIIAEGYTLPEEEKFRKDLVKAVDTFFRCEPYQSHRNDFNIYGVFEPSQESGTDEPSHGIFKNTAAGSSFDALGLYRYLLTEDNRNLRDIAGHVPYDAIIIMVNTKRYGGGGIYNTYCVFTMDEANYNYLFLHEFGHSFAGLADEYYASTVAYNEFYPAGIEPTEPNITALLDVNNLKWKNLVSKGVKIPTPWEKEKYDQMSQTEQEKHLLKPQYRSIIGAFEGAGYASKGLYRPMADCLMFSRGMKPYCIVCEQAIIRIIQHYTQ